MGGLLLLYPHYKVDGSQTMSHAHSVTARRFSLESMLVISILVQQSEKTLVAAVAKHRNSMHGSDMQQRQKKTTK